MPASSSAIATARNCASTSWPRVSRAPRAASWKSAAAIPRSSRVLSTVAWSSEASRWRATRASTSTGPIAWRSEAPAAGRTAEVPALRTSRSTVSTSSPGRWSLVR